MNYSIKKYTHITKSDREAIKSYLEINLSIRKIANILHKNPSTVSREIKRNLDKFGKYSPFYADIKAQRRHYHKYYFKFLNSKYSEFSELFLKKFDKKYYGVKLTHKYIKENFKIKIPCLKTVFNWIKTNKWIIKRSNLLRSSYKKGGKRHASVISRLVTSADYVFPIWTRPKSIDNREEYGHWEADMIVGKRATGYNNILTLTERKTRVGFAILIPSKNPMKVNAALRKLVLERQLIVKTITIDNGIEFEKIGILAKWLDIKIYRAEPYASFQRGSNEHWNGLIRREYKKGFDFNQISQEILDQITKRINDIPREILGWKSANDLFIEANFYGLVW
ncbi:transposase [Mycoplasmopsis californica]|uniref:IS30 family transposase n=1 Tax=Mycoplasmopsis californica TaxID=2113 RepID=UPI000EB6FA8A|nr:IS30 family transposase [Mycoplasmopsis californica]BBG40652.1 transposase [Mycoplasmopsis californica]BBG40807.1 transposase [Mycoplasmopsis californica]BBG41247.1 transposase [Mycoplasmopsis californica]BBG41401.1 transposase [Mycoplasmopsis californica]BBG41840.1 transposase [Mycoplasmopsis californica]